MLIKKKSQISIFIIISLILIIVSTFLYYNNKSDFYFFTSDKVQAQINDIVNTCIEKDAKTGTFLLGFQGGRIDLPEYIKKDPINFKQKYVDLGFKIVNWDSLNTNDIPTINNMQTQLENYISKNSYSCIKSDLTSLKDSLNITIQDTKLKVDVKINENNIAVQAELPIKYNKINSQNSFSLSNYFISLDNVKLKKEFELATKIYDKEVNENFLEKLVLEQIYSANDYNSPESMPTEGMNIACGVKIWTINQLKRNLANLNNNNFRYLQFLGTYSKQNLLNLNFNKINNNLDFKKYYQSSVVGYVQNLGSSKSSFKNFDVQITMPSVEQTGKKGYFQKYPYRKFEVNPSNGQIVKPTNLKIGSGYKIPIPCIQIYHELYSLDYDLMVKIVDKSIEGNNYFFQFPIRILIDKNMPKKNTNFLFNNFNLIPATSTNEKYNSNSSKLYPLYVYVKDKSTGNYLENVNISYNCGSLSADIGKTLKRKIDLGDGRIIQRENSASFLRAKFPFCIGGEIIAEKKGYFNGIKKGIRTDNSLLNFNGTEITGSGKNIIELNLIPKLNFNIGISSFLLVNKDTLKSMYLKNETDGSIYIDIENKRLDFSSQILYPIESKGFYDKLTFLNDEDVTYNITAYYMDSDNNLKGMFRLNNWKPNLNLISSNSKVEFIIPISSTKIDEKNYQSFSDYSNFVVSSGKYGIKFN